MPSEPEGGVPTKTQPILTGVPIVAAEKLGIPYEPGEDYTVVQCQVCGGDMWIGPKQAEYKADRPFTPLVCMVCSITVFGVRDTSRVKKLSDD